MTLRYRLMAVLVMMGAAWGLSLPLAKIAVSTGHAPLGLVVWELVFAVTILLIISLMRRKPVVLKRRDVGMFAFVALFGTLVPTTLWFVNARHLPAGVLAIVISLVPMFSLPIAVSLRLEKFSWVRLLGVILGLLAIVLLVGPSTSLPDPSKVGFVLLALIGPICYGIEGNGVAKFGIGDLDAVELILGASLLSLCIAVPAALLTGQWVNLWKIWAAPEWAIFGAAVVSTLAYVTYLWLVGRAGPVFAAQVSYLVTGFGVFWAIILLGEQYSGWVWGALLLMLGGLFLVQPRGQTPS